MKCEATPGRRSASLKVQSSSVVWGVFMQYRSLIAFLFAAFCASNVQAKEAPLKGLANPSLAFGVSLLRDWETAKPFINLVHFMRPFSFTAKNGAKIQRKDLPADVFDEHGWIKRIPAKVKFAITIWHWNKKAAGSAQHKGDYILTYDGEGELELKLDARITRRKPGRIEFSNRSGEGIQLLIKSTDPKGKGDYIRNIKLMRKEHVALYHAGAMFNPEWLAAVADARQVRFLNWMQANSSNQKRWTDRPRMRNATWAMGRGVPVEVMVRLANEIGADPWFTMPHRADPDYNRAFASYVRDNLDPRLKAHVEYSNELWNRQFGQTKELIAAAKRAGRGITHDQLVAQRSYDVMEIWKEVFGAEADRRLVRVLGSWQASPEWTEKLLSHRLKSSDGRQRGRVADGFDAIAVSTYFGGGKKMEGRLLETWRADGDAHQKMKAILEDPKLGGSPTKMIQRLKRHARLAERNGLKLLSYEGGQHLHTGRVHRLGGWKFNHAIERFIYSDEMASMYQDVWQAWREIGDGPFMQFVAVQRSSKDGSWGLQRFLGEASPAWRVLTRLNRETPAWWGDAGGPQYQQGYLVGERGSIGTAEEDYLIGGDGDDVFHPSTGSDGVSGGGGYDVVVLPGPKRAYSVDRLPGQVIVKNGRETKRLVGIEELRFSDGAAVKLGD